MKTPYDFLLIDDDPTSNMICQLLIKKVIAPDRIHIFDKPEAGLKFIESYPCRSDKPMILLLDINMPGMSGWELLDEFVKLKSSIQDLFKIYILTSAIQDFDREREKYPFLQGFLAKPLKTAKLLEIHEELLESNEKKKMA